MTDSIEKRVVEAEEFVLMDAQGRPRARLGMMSTEEPILTLCDPAGTPRLILSVGQDGPVVVLADEHGTVLGELSCYAGGALLHLHAAKSDASAALVAMEAEPRLRFSDPRKAFTLAVSVSNGGLHVSTPQKWRCAPHALCFKARPLIASNCRWQFPDFGSGPPARP